MTDNNSTSAALSAGAEEAYQRVLPEAQALGLDALATINVDIPTSIITAMSVSERLVPYAMALKALPDFPPDGLTKYPDYVLALFIAQSRYALATTPAEALPELLTQATARRDVMIAEGKTLIARGLLNSDALDDLTGTHGYRNVAFDLSGLTQLFKAAWPNIQGKTGMQQSEIDEAGQVALTLAAAIAHRENKESIAEATDTRQRVFTLFSTSYDQIRRGMSYLRWNQGDVDEIVPSLYAGRQNSNAAKKATSDAKTNSFNNGQTPTTSTVAPAPTNPSTGVPTGAIKVPVGFPGSDPLSKS